jgi:hypothetical protein
LSIDFLEVLDFDLMFFFVLCEGVDDRVEFVDVALLVEEGPLLESGYLLLVDIAHLIRVLELHALYVLEALLCTDRLSSFWLVVGSMTVFLELNAQLLVYYLKAVVLEL